MDTLNHTSFTESCKTSLASSRSKAVEVKAS